MEELIQNFDVLLQQKWSSFYQTLLPGISAEDIESLESKLGINLPEEFKLFYQWKNGQSTNKVKPLWYNRNLMNIEEVLETWTCMNELLALGEFEQPNWWDPHWIPFAENGAGDYYVLDLVGSFGGTPGQVIEFWNGDVDRNIYFASFSKWLETIISAIEQGYQNLESDSEIFEQTYRKVNPGFPLKHLADEEV